MILGEEKGLCCIVVQLITLVYLCAAQLRFIVHVTDGLTRGYVQPYTGHEPNRQCLVHGGQILRGIHDCNTQYTQKKNKI